VFGAVLPRKGCTLTVDDKKTTTVTYNQTTHWTGSDGTSHEDTTSTNVTYNGSISQEGVLSKIFQNVGGGILESVEQSLSNITGSNVRLTPGGSETPPALAAAAWARSLGNLAGQAGQKAADVARSQGANGSNIREMGHWADKTLKEAAEGAVRGDPGAQKALKIIKQAGRLSQKY
jgi:hypothetical protein